MKLFLVYLFTCLVLINAGVDSKYVHVSSRVARSTQGNTYGNKVRSYSVSSSDERKRMAKYVADGEGVRSTVTTNEQGTNEQKPALVTVVSSSNSASPAILESAPQPQVVHPSGQGTGPTGYAYGTGTGATGGPTGGPGADTVTGTWPLTSVTQGFHYSTASHVPFYSQAGPGPHGVQQQTGQGATGPTLTSTLGRSWHLMPVSSGYSPYTPAQYAGVTPRHLVTGNPTGGQVYQPTNLVGAPTGTGAGVGGGSPLFVSFVPYGTQQYGPGGQPQPGTGVSYAPVGGLGTGSQGLGPYGVTYGPTGGQGVGPYGGPQTGGPIVPYAAVGGQGTGHYQPQASQTSVVAYTPIGGQGGPQLPGPLVTYSGYGKQEPQFGNPLTTYAMIGGQGAGLYKGPQPGPTLVPYSTHGGQGFQPVVPVVTYSLDGQGPAGFQPEGQQGGQLVPLALTGGQGQGQGKAQGPTYIVTGGSAGVPVPGQPTLVTEVVTVPVVGTYSANPTTGPTGTSYTGPTGQTPNQNAVHYAPNPGPSPGQIVGPVTGTSQMGPGTVSGTGQMGPGPEGGIGGPVGAQESQLIGRSGNIAQTTLQNW